MNSFEAFSNSSVSFMNSFDFLGIVLNCLGIVLRFLGIALGILGIALGSSQRHQINRPRQPLRYPHYWKPPMVFHLNAGCTSNSREVQDTQVSIASHRQGSTRTSRVVQRSCCIPRATSHGSEWHSRIPPNLKVALPRIAHGGCRAHLFGSAEKKSGRWDLFDCSTEVLSTPPRIGTRWASSGCMIHLPGLDGTRFFLTVV